MPPQFYTEIELTIMALEELENLEPCPRKSKIGSLFQFLNKNFPFRGIKSVRLEGQKETGGDN